MEGVGKPRCRLAIQLLSSSIQAGLRRRGAQQWGETPTRISGVIGSVSEKNATGRKSNRSRLELVAKGLDLILPGFRDVGFACPVVELAVVAVLSLVQVGQ